jgi:hypothetical protein
MKKHLVVAGLVVAALAAGATSLVVAQQEAPGSAGMPDFPAPQKEHEWLQKLVGEWTVEYAMVGPGMPEMKSSGTDEVRSLGGRWIVSDVVNEIPGVGSMSAVLTLGYDPEKSKYVGTWVDSMTNHLWVYDGTLDSTGKILTLEAEGPNMMDPTSKKDVKYRDVIEVKSADLRTWTSSAQDDSGKWQQFMTATARRKK